MADNISFDHVVVISRPHRFISLNEKQCLILSRVGCHLLEIYEYKILEKCRHAEDPFAVVRQVAAMTCLPVTRVREGMARLLKIGLLQPTNRLYEICHKSVAECKPEPLLLAVITRNRPETLAACVASLFENARHFERVIELIIIDNSSHEHARANLAALGAFKNLPGDIRYCGANERDAYVSRFKARGIASSTIQRMIDPRDDCPAYGAARNLVLLDSAGSQVLSVDDDTVIHAAVHPNRRQDMALWGHAPPFEYWFFKSRMEAVAAARWELCDVIGEHAALLGRALGDCLLASSNYMEACGHLFDIEAEPRIIGTMPGKVGASGRIGNIWADFILSRRAAPTETPAIENGDLEIIEVAASTAIAHGFGCMAGVLGLDNRELLPPFPPCYRSEDAVFALMLERAHPQGFWGIPNHALLHNRPHSTPNTISSLTMGHSDVTAALIAERTRVGPIKNAAAEYNAMGEWLSAHGNLDQSELQRIALRILGPRQAAMIAECENLARTDSSPSRRMRWHKYREEIFDDVKRLAIPCDDKSVMHESDWKSYGIYLNEYGKILKAWSEAWILAREFRLNGFRASVPLKDLI